MIIYSINIGLCLVILIVGIYATMSSILERKLHASTIMFSISIVVAFCAFLSAFYLSGYSAFIFPLFFLLTSFILLIPFKKNLKIPQAIVNQQIDERITIFSRAELKPGTINYNQFYAKYPKLLKSDNRFRQNPGLLQPKSRYYNKEIFEAANTNFTKIISLQNRNNPAVSTKKITVQNLSKTLKQQIKNSEAHSVGICELKNIHYYSHKGRGTSYGKVVEQRHKFAIAFTVEMDYREISFAPDAPVVKESSKQYLKSAEIAIKTAEFLSKLGYEAQAHIDGNYEVVCPLVAVDSGLGTIGRMGILMTPDLGPRVRIAVVTTNAKLIPDKPKDFSYIIDFCNHCTKCATNCPSQCIPKHNYDSTKRWKINQEKCYYFWTLAGTDCAICMKVCPFSHKNNLLHKTIRMGIKNNRLFRMLAIKADNFLYPVQR
jgi:reductive dehalogenase